nr:hypothetical protein [uncultured Albidiferax sp.]
MASIIPSAPLRPLPYGSFLLAASPTALLPQDLDGLLKGALKAIKEKVIAGGGRMTQKTTVLQWPSVAGVQTVAAHYEVATNCTWEATLYDTSHELILICCKADHLAIHCSDSDHRRVLASLVGATNATLTHPQLVRLRKLSAGHLTSAFLQSGPLKAMWLAGTHRSVQVKPDSKILSGADLEHALDPLGDSTYLAAAARGASIGVSLNSSGVWTKAYASPADLMAAINQLLDTIIAAVGTSAVLPVLANELHSFTGVGQVFDFEVGPLELAASVARRRTVESLLEHTAFEVLPPSAASAARPGGFDLRIIRRFAATGGAPAPAPSVSVTVHPIFSSAASPALGLVVSGAPAAIAEPRLQEALSLLGRTPALFRVFYDSGHTISAGHLSLAIVRDRPFARWIWGDFGVAGGAPLAFQVDKEKPAGNDLALLWTLPTEDSLFSWFLWAVADPVQAGKLDLPLLTAVGDTWVFCDDDSGEVADFVYVHAPAAGRPLVCLVHIKGARSKSLAREMVAGPYEVVCGQAVKNIRFIDAGTLLRRIQHRVLDLARPLWNAPNAIGAAPVGNRAAFSARLAALGTNVDYRVMVVQPHVTETAYGLPLNQPTALPPALGAVQLRSLLSGTDNAARAVGAKFHVVGAA